MKINTVSDPTAVTRTVKDVVYDEVWTVMAELYPLALSAGEMVNLCTKVAKNVATRLEITVSLAVGDVE